jgi:hypothetical protein
VTRESVDLAPSSPRDRRHPALAGLSERVSARAEAFWSWYTATTRSVYGLAVARMLVAASVFGSVVSNFSTRQYSYGATWTGHLAAPTSEFAALFPYTLLWQIAATPPGLTALFVAALVGSVGMFLGVFTKTSIAVLLTAWVTVSQLTSYTADQSDNLIRITLVFLLLARCDAVLSVRAHRHPLRPAGILRSAVHNGALIALGAQVCFVYAAGGFYKASGAAWSGGYAIYDPLHVKQFSTWPELADLVTAWGPGVALLTTATVVVQAWFPVLLLTDWTRRVALVVMIGFHAGIGLLMGLPWFSLSALALDAIFVRDTTWRRLRDALRSHHFTRAGRE